MANNLKGKQERGAGESGGLRWFERQECLDGEEYKRCACKVSGFTRLFNWLLEQGSECRG